MGSIPGVLEPGTVLVFPDLVKRADVTPENARDIVRSQFVDFSLPPSAEPLDGIWVFVCAHAKRDVRCGVCGPQLIKEFVSESKRMGISSRVNVLGCSHTGGHKYAGNVIIFGRTKECGQVIGDWYGYVTPSRVADILSAVEGNDVVYDLWRG